MSVELDHLIVFCSAGAPEAEELVRLGLTEGSPNIHTGQGTANRRFFFQNAFIELLWVSDPNEVQTEPVRGTQLWERWSGRLTNACPFGVVLRPSIGPANATTPFPTWAYRPPYLPPGLAIEVAEDVPLTEPAYFYLGFANASLPIAREPRKHALGLNRITGIAIGTPTSGMRSAATISVEAAGLLSLHTAERWLMTVTFDNARSGGSADLRPVLPLTLKW